MIKTLSVVIPVCNEEDNVLPLVKKLDAVLTKLSLKNFEVLFVDDGSSDKTYPRLEHLLKQFNYLKLIKLKRNFGKAMAYSVGFAHSLYEVIVTMDGDLQNEPEQIGQFLDKINAGYDLVVGWQKTGKGSWQKTIVSRIFNFVTAAMFNLKLHDIDCPFKAYRKSVITGLNIYSGLYRFIPIFAASYGFKMSEIPVVNYPRLHGQSKYSGNRLLSGFLDFLTVFFLTRFNLNPMHFFGSLALTCIAVGTPILGYLTVLSFEGEKVGSRPLFQLGVLLEIMSLQFFSIGFIGEMLTRSLIKTDPDYIVDKIISTK